MVFELIIINIHLMTVPYHPRRPFRILQNQRLMQAEMVPSVMPHFWCDYRFRPLQDEPEFPAFDHGDIRTKSCRVVMR